MEASRLQTTKLFWRKVRNGANLSGVVDQQGPELVEDLHLKQEVTRIEEERIQVLNNMEELEQKIKDLDNQMEESIREVRGW